MDREQVKAVTLQGIVHNATKIGVQDGQSEDIVNLRFKDGSWRTSSNGRQVFKMSNTFSIEPDKTPSIRSIYEQLYIHTNVYRHLLGVREGTLYWIANIDTEGVFEPLQKEVALAAVSGDLYYGTNGHLLTVIDEKQMKYLLFSTSKDTYIVLDIDTNGAQSSREVYPFGQIHFNYMDAGEEGTIREDKAGKEGWGRWGGAQMVSGAETFWNNNASSIRFEGYEDRLYPVGDEKVLHDEMVTLYGKILEKNYFTDPMVVCAAIKLYDGSYLYASTPIVIAPRWGVYDNKERYVRKNNTDSSDYTNPTIDDYDKIKSYAAFSPRGAVLKIGSRFVTTMKELQDMFYREFASALSAKVYDNAALLTDEAGIGNTTGRVHARQLGDDTAGVFQNGICAGTYCDMTNYHYYYLFDSAWMFSIRGFNLCVSIDEVLVDTMRKNRDIFKSLCIFATPQSYIYDMEKLSSNHHIRISLDCYKPNNIDVRCSAANASFIPDQRSHEDICYDLIHSPLYLLREYEQDELPNLLNNPVVDLQSKKYEGRLVNLTQQDILQVESMSRYSYDPKVQYNYNGRLHIANYIQTQFHGYPLDSFHLHNHGVVPQSNVWYKGRLRGLKPDPRDILWSRCSEEYTFADGYGHDYGALEPYRQAGDVFAYVEVEIEASDGIQRVCRYIPIAQNTQLHGSKEDFIEALNPMVSFPDNRAKKMILHVATFYPHSNDNVTVYEKEVSLVAHPYMNIAYYMEPNLKRIVLDRKYSKSFADYVAGSNKPPQETNIDEEVPNGIKVSSTNNPLYFPVEHTYRVGSGGIVAMMANAIAVGTGQTGDAPLYVFCTDGVYALFVDSMGELAYQSSRVIARDVCNNPKSVTSIDTGVVFTTDRGLMLLAGQVVDEIGQSLEGDWVHYTSPRHRDHSLVAHNAYTMEQIAGLAEDTMTQVDFLTYLKGSIINYNHNERELMVSNPEYGYSYVLDRSGHWSRKSFTAVAYVNNYPTSYRVERVSDDIFNRKHLLYQVDKDSDGSNRFFVMSHILKLDSIGFKELHRVVVRGYFETIDSTLLGLYVFGSYDGRRWACLGHREKKGFFTDMGAIVERTDCRFFRIVLAGKVSADTRIDYVELSSRESKISTKIR